MNNKISIIEPVGGHGGMDYYDFGLCDGLSSSGLDVVLHTCDETEKSPDQSFDVKFTYAGIYGDAPSWKRGLRYVVGSVKAMFTSILERRKIVHFHFFHVGTLALMNVILARLAFRKVVITAHDVESFVAALEVPFMSRLAYRFSHGIIAHNKSSQTEVVRYLNVAKTKVKVIPSGNYLHVAERSLSIKEARGRLGISEKAKVLLFFGQIKSVKKLDLLLSAMPKVLQQHPDAILLIAGKTWNTDFSTYQQQIDRLGIEHACISHIRFIPDEELPAYYGCADLVVLPYERIYQSAVVLMAMSYGKAVLVSDLPSMIELINDKVNGFIFHRGDIDSLTKNIVSILNNNYLRNEVASRGLTCMQDDYNWASIGQATAEYYGEIYD